MNNSMNHKELIHSDFQIKEVEAVVRRDHSHRHRVLTRFEIENYLFDKAVLKKFCEKRRIPFDEESYDILVTNIAEDAIKDRVIKIKEICTIDANTPNDLFKIQLSECITEDMPVYLELEACIFY